jgi:hypothetical protein
VHGVVGMLEWLGYEACCIWSQWIAECGWHRRTIEVIVIVTVTITV